MMKTLTAKELPKDAEMPGGGCSLRCAMDWETIASSHLEPQDHNNYEVRNIYDGRRDTAWVVKGSGIHETITFIFTEEEFKKARIEKTNLWGLVFINGYCKNEKTWKENSRVHKFQLEHNGESLFEVILHDSMNIQEIIFDKVWLYPGATIRLKILEIYQGKKYLDTAITEVLLEGAH
jgi:hypothetical protein